MYLTTSRALRFFSLLIDFKNVFKWNISLVANVLQINFFWPCNLPLGNPCLCSIHGFRGFWWSGKRLCSANDQSHWSRTSLASSSESSIILTHSENNALPGIAFQGLRSSRRQCDGGFCSSSRSGPFFDKFSHFLDGRAEKTHRSMKLILCSHKPGWYPARSFPLLDQGVACHRRDRLWIRQTFFMKIVKFAKSTPVMDHREFKQCGFVQHKIGCPSPIQRETGPDWNHL